MWRAAIGAIAAGWLFTAGADAEVLGISPSPRTLFNQNAAVTVANTLTETTVLGGGVGSLTIPANYFAAGKGIKITAFGFNSTVSNPTMRVRIYLGSTVILDTGTATVGNDTNESIEFRALITGVTTGSSGSVWAQGFMQEESGQGGVAQWGMTNTNAVTLNTTTTQTLNITAQWGTASTSDTITMTNILVEAI